MLIIEVAKTGNAAANIRPPYILVYFPAQNCETCSLGQNRLAARKLQGRADLN
jgi:hypothetical protein